MRVGDMVEVSKDRLSYDGVCQLYSICSKGEFHYSAFARDERYRVEQVEKSPLGTYIYLDRKPGRFNVVNFDLVQTKEDTWLEREERARRMMGLGPAVSRPVGLQIGNPRIYHHLNSYNGKTSSLHVQDSRGETLMKFEDLEGNSNVEWKDDQSDILVIKQLVKLNL